MLIKEQECQFDLLNDKIKNWNDFGFEKNNNLNEKNKKLRELIVKKRKQQKKHLALFKLKRAVIPEAVNKTYVELNNLYLGDNGKVLFNELTNKMASL